MREFSFSHLRTCNSTRYDHAAEDIELCTISNNVHAVSKGNYEHDGAHKRFSSFSCPSPAGMLRSLFLPNQSSCRGSSSCCEQIVTYVLRDQQKLRSLYQQSGGAVTHIMQAEDQLMR